jgi:hypothetical protein
MAEMIMSDAARRRADLIELLQLVHLRSEAASVMVEVHGWKVVGGLAGCHRRRASQDAAVKERGMWGVGSKGGMCQGCDRAGMQGSRDALVMPGWSRGERVLQCMDEAEDSHFCYVLTPF